MYVLKRNNSLEKFDSQKIKNRIERLRDGMGFLESLSKDYIDSEQLVNKITDRLYDNIPSWKIDEQTSQICANMNTHHPDFGRLASRIAINNLHKETENTFTAAMEALYNNYDEEGNHSPIINSKLYKLTKQYSRQINQRIVSSLDYSIDFFGFMTLFKAYLLRVNDKVIERPQYMWMRIALSIHGNNLEEAFKSYHYMSNGYFTHATPTLFHAGTKSQQLSSCFLLGTEDSVEDIYKTISDIAKISKWAGGIGLHLSNVRARGSRIKSTDRKSDGIVPLLKVLNSTARYINQSGRRNGSIAIYLELWHGDIFSFLEAKKNIGNEEERARDLFYALWIPDLFMKRLEKDEEWTLMCPDKCPDLTNTYGDEFEKLYTKYEREDRGIKKVKARKLFEEIINAQIETGTPYMLYKDTCNRKSNQKNLGVIKSSNLCAEIIEYSDSKEYSVCNLASIALHQFVVDDINDMNPYVDFNLLGQIVRIIVNNLDIIIDENFYPTPETQLSNNKHRPIGIGVQGLADLFIKMNLPFDSDEAKQLNKQLFECIYFNALTESCRLAKIKKPYESFDGSPLSMGQFQFNLWNVKPSDKYDWEELRRNIKTYGIRNSQLIALMPTASTSQILGSNECIEPFTSNLYVRRTMAGEFTIINKYLIHKLLELNLWTESIREKIFRNRGSVQGISEIPKYIQDLFKTVWEIKQRKLLEQSADRGAFVCQSQSLNLFFKNPNFNTLYSVHMTGWKLGLKTGSYYIRTAPAVDMQQFTLEPEKKKELEDDDDTVILEKCTLQEGCVMCGS